MSPSLWLIDAEATPLLVWLTERPHLFQCDGYRGHTPVSRITGHRGYFIVPGKHKDHASFSVTDRHKATPSSMSDPEVMLHSTEHKYHISLSKSIRLKGHASFSKSNWHKIHASFSRSNRRKGHSSFSVTWDAKAMPTSEWLRQKGLASFSRSNRHKGYGSFNATEVQRPRLLHCN